MKKKLFSIAVTVICLSLLAGSTLAYYTSQDTVRNVITSGGIDAEAVEKTTTGTVVPFSEEAVGIMPGSTVYKAVCIRSNLQSAWIRVRYTLTVRTADGKVMELTQAQLKNLITLIPDSNNWTEKDGWWYYPAAVGEGNVTQPLFTTLSFSGTDLDNRFQNGSVEITVTVQAVQQANNGTSALDAEGWPAD